MDIDLMTARRIELVRRHKKIRDVAADLGIDYHKVVKIFGSFEQEPVDFDKRFRELLKAWDGEQNESR